MSLSFINASMERSKTEKLTSRIISKSKLCQIYPVKCEAIFVLQKLFNGVNSKSNLKSKIQKEMI